MRAEEVSYSAEPVFKTSDGTAMKRRIKEIDFFSMGVRPLIYNGCILIKRGFISRNTIEYLPLFLYNLY